MFQKISLSQEARLLRFPATNGKQIVFTYAGDLYTVDMNGGVARKLTAHEGFEMFARFSPDGQKIAFSGQYDGNTEVYVMPAEGGIPRRLTYTATLKRDDVSDRMGPNNIVMTWTPDGKHIIFRSRMRSFNDFIGQLFKVSLDAELPEPLPFSTGGFCSFSPDGKKIAFNRVFREFRTWKYYQGGMADDIRIFDFETKQTINITNHIAQDIFPMWIDDEIFFVSDRDRIANIFCYNLTTGQTQKVTDFKEYDVKFPSHWGQWIVFENGGYIYKMHAKEKKPQKVPIIIQDDQIWSRPSLIDASQYIQHAHISPDGQRIVISARGEIFTVPAESGVTRQLTNNSSVHNRNAVWSPDGKYIAYLSDQSGEFEIHIISQDGSEPSRQITTGAETYYFSLKWSPDSRYLLFNDKKMRLSYVDIITGKVHTITTNPVWEITQFEWSPDGKWIVWTNPEDNQMTTIRVYNIETKETFNITDNWYRSYNPAFSADGKYIVFVSDRDFNPIYSKTEWNHAYIKMSRPYIAILSKDTPHPLAPKNNEVSLQGSPQQEQKKEKNKRKSETLDEEKKSVHVVIDPEHIAMRIVALPVEPNDYWNVSLLNNKVYYIRKTKDDKNSALYLFDLEKREETEIAECSWYQLSHDQKKMLIHKDKNYYVVDVPTAALKLEKKVDLSGMQIWIDKQAEWKQIYYESWRQMRDFFYVPNLHNIDWESMKHKYEVLLPHCHHRHDLNYIIGELIAELNVGHAYVGGGHMPELKRIPLGLLGAQIEKDKSGYFRIVKILEGASWSNTLRSPLLEPGINVKEGDYLIEINGTDLKNISNPYMLLVGHADKLVEITVNNKPSASGSRKVFIKPIEDESQLYYYNWVQHNIRKVNEATNGQVGYVHIPDMGVNGLNEFARYFYPQLNKRALIIDDRGNGGGNVSPMIIERLQRQIQRANMARNVQVPSYTPRQMLYGPIVVLVNQYSASDGDLFPYGIKHYGIAKVIGVRTWGGVVGIRGSLPFRDGMQLHKPEFASYDHRTGEWIIEGWGVEPDIIIDNDPYEEFLGRDAQLEKAIEIILEEMQKYPPIHPIPDGPDKSR